MCYVNSAENQQKNIVMLCEYEMVHSAQLTQDFQVQLLTQILYFDWQYGKINISFVIFLVSQFYISNSLFNYISIIATV